MIQLTRVLLDLKEIINYTHTQTDQAQSSTYEMQILSIIVK